MHCGLTFVAVANASTPRKDTSANAILGTRRKVAGVRISMSVDWTFVKVAAVTILQEVLLVIVPQVLLFLEMANIAQVYIDKFQIYHYVMSNCFFANVDHDECQDTGMCANGHCTNMNGSFKCKCNDGYVLSPTQNTCIGIIDSPKIIIFCENE